MAISDREKLFEDTEMHAKILLQLYAEDGVTEVQKKSYWAQSDKFWDKLVAEMQDKSYRQGVWEELDKEFGDKG